MKEKGFDLEAVVAWDRHEAVFTDNRYSRRHSWIFDGGAVVGASASPHIVPTPFSDPSAVDPEEAFVVALASCHMLFFLSIAARRGYIVDSYRDDALGTMGENGRGEMAMTRVVLRPNAVFSGDRRPERSEIEAIHELAHHECFLARSVKTDVRVEMDDFPGPMEKSR